MKDQPTPSGGKEGAFKGCQRWRQPLNAETAPPPHPPPLVTLETQNGFIGPPGWVLESPEKRENLTLLQARSSRDPSAAAPGTNIKESIGRSKQRPAAGFGCRAEGVGRQTRGDQLSGRTTGRKHIRAVSTPRRRVSLITHIQLNKPAFTCPTSEPERPRLLQMTRVR